MKLRAASIILYITPDPSIAAELFALAGESVRWTGGARLTCYG
jgi:hypothetical protein